MTNAELIARVGDGLAARAALADLGCYRLFDGYGEGAPGIAVDRYHDTAVVRFRGDLGELALLVAERIAEEPGIERVLCHQRGVGHAARAIIGDVPAGRVQVSEGPIELLLDFRRAGNPGLYLDARPARDWLRQGSAADRRVLNLFAFTGSLGIAAALGGARSVVHVDSHKPTLAWARANCTLNGLRVDDRDFARINVYQHMRKAGARRQKFGGIIADPPPGSSTPLPKDHTPGDRGIAALAPMAADMLEPGGWLLCFFHHDERSHDELDAGVTAICGLEPIWRGASGPDFRDPDGGARTRMTAFSRV